MNQFHLERVEHSSNGRFALALSATVAALVVVAGAAALLSGGLGAPRVVGPGMPEPTATATATATVTPTPTASAASATTSTGQLVCRQTAAGTSNMVAGVTQVRNATLDCAATASDPRLAGQTLVTYQGDYAADGGATLWGTTMLRTSSGTWAGSWRGAVDAATGTSRAEGVLFGSGGDDGLRVRYTNTGSGETFSQVAVIEASDTVPPAGSTVVYGTTCSVANGGITNPNGDVSGLVLICNGNPSDPRLVGKFTVTLDMAMRPDGGGDMTGTIDIAGASNAWSGPLTGRIDAGYTTHHVHARLAGTGADAGLVFTFDMVGLSEDQYVATGTVTSSGH